jgi:hypothetical protein
LATISYTPGQPVNTGKKVSFGYASQWLSYSVKWDFGDGSTGASSAPLGGPTYVDHTYTQPGTYTVNAVASAFPFGSDSASADIQIVTTGGNTGGSTIGKGPSPQPQSGLPAVLFGNLDDLLDKAATEPGVLAAKIRTSIEAIAVAGAILSLIPTESNVGGPLAARLIERLLHPFTEAAYTAPILDRLQAYFPTGHVQARMLVAMVQDGSIEEADLVAELVLGGVRNESIKIISRYARVKRFEAETKDDVALVKSYYDKWLTAQIAEAQDTEKAIIADLKAQRKALTGTSKVSLPPVSTIG